MNKKRLPAVTLLMLALFSVVSTEALAQRRGDRRDGEEDNGERHRGGGHGMSAEERAFLQGLSEDERERIRALDRSERRQAIHDLMARKRGGGSVSASTDANPLSVLEKLDGYVPPAAIADDIRLMIGKVRGRENMAGAVAIQKARGGTETGLEPAFIGGAACPEIDSEKWAIDYSHKRPWPAIHKGVDIPQPRGTPVRAVADGTVVGRFANDGNRKGIEVMLRHAPEQTGLPFWTYSQYTHLREMSPLPVGTAVKMGQEIGRTSNTGKMGRRIRRDALHFAILYSRSPEWSNDGRFVMPKDSYWMDPNAFYRREAPWDSRSLAGLPDDAKKIPVPYRKPDGTFIPSATKRIWPYNCG